MAVDVTDVLAGLLARNRGPDPLDPDTRRQSEYGVEACLDGNALSAVLTFRRGAPYCCMEWGCHLALTDGRRWESLHEALAGRGVAAPDRLELRLSCVIEEGAVFFNLFRPDPARRNWYAFEPVAAHSYEAASAEAASAEEAEPRAAADGPRL